MEYRQERHGDSIYMSIHYSKPDRTTEETHQWACNDHGRNTGQAINVACVSRTIPTASSPTYGGNSILYKIPQVKNWNKY